MDMRTIDLSPLYRASVGFDRLFQTLDSVSQESALSYPPYNIEKVSEDAYRIVMAVAGFGEGELDVTAQENSLVITGSTATPEEGPQEDPQLGRAPCRERVSPSGQPQVVDVSLKKTKQPHPT